MRQLFFVSPRGNEPVRKAFCVDRDIYAMWTDGDYTKDSCVGVIELKDTDDAELAIEKLESQGIMWLPNHHTGEQIKPEHATELARFGVLPTHTTAEAMGLVYAKAGWRPLKPQRF
jgi:hypothetical protein